MALSCFSFLPIHPFSFLSFFLSVLGGEVCLKSSVRESVCLSLCTHNTASYTYSDVQTNTCEQYCVCHCSRTKSTALHGTHTHGTHSCSQYSLMLSPYHESTVTAPPHMCDPFPLYIRLHTVHMVTSLSMRACLCACNRWSVAHHSSV